ncbi:MAG: hypothetical protein AB8B65_02620 [Kordia sp.]|uniref:hypothetical protein n=1 Tax=Kordia sp. TaxID=1965332 RepID=UPI003859689E
MSNFKFHEAPDFWLRKKLEAMDNDEFPPFRTFPNTIGDCEYQENFISTNIDEKKLIEDLSSSFYFKRNKFDANKYIKDKKGFKSSKVRDFNNREIVKDGIRVIQKRDKLLKTPFTKEQLEREIEKFNYKNLASSLILNTTKCYLNNSTQKNSFEVNIDINNKSVTYTYYIYFEDLDKKNHSRSAIVLRTGDAELLLFFLEKVYGKYEAKKIRKVIWKKFLYQLNEKEAIKELIFLYDKLPSYIRLGYHAEVEKETKPYKIFDTTLWRHFKMFADYDKGTSDASYYVVYIMTLITPKYCMEKFMEDQKLVLQVYENLDDQSDIEAFFGWYDFSKTFPGSSSFEPTNRDVFATMLNSYVQLFEGNAKLCVFESSGAHFYQGIHDVRPQAKEEWKHTVTYTLNAGLEDGKIHLENSWKSEEKLGYTLLPSNRFSKSRSVVDIEFSNGFNEIGNYNPLDVIKFTQYNDKGEAVTMNVPAIFIRHVSYIKKWERIGKVIRFGFNILMIVGSAATIYSGTSSMMLYAAITDMGLATGDIFVQGKELKKSDYVGQEAQNFLRLWNEIYNTLGLVTFSPVAIKVVTTNAPKIVHSGANILQGTGKIFLKKEAYKKVKELTLKAIHNLEIPNFNKTGLQIVPKGKKIFGLTNISKLQNLGVIFVKGAKNTIAAIYKGIVIASGKVKIVALQLRTALRKLRGDKLKKHLDDIVELAGSAENLRVIRDVDAFIASRARLDSLKITGENALQYLDDALPHFNHEVVEKVVNGKTEKVVVQIGKKNCVSVVEVVEKFLRTGEITKAKRVKRLKIRLLEKEYGGTFFQYRPETLKDVRIMKDGDRGIMYGVREEGEIIINGVREWYSDGHVFNVIKVNGQVLFRDGQSGLMAVLKGKGYIKFKYMQTNK